MLHDSVTTLGTTQRFDASKSLGSGSEREQGPGARVGEEWPAQVDGCRLMFPLQKNSGLMLDAGMA